MSIPAIKATPGRIWRRSHRGGRPLVWSVYYLRPQPSAISGTAKADERPPTRGGPWPVAGPAEARKANRLGRAFGRIESGPMRGQAYPSYSGEDAYLLGRLAAGWPLFRAVTRHTNGTETARWVCLPADEPMHSIATPPPYPKEG